MEFTCLLPIYRADDPELFIAAADSVMGSTLAPSEILICQDGEAPAPLAAAIARVARAPRVRVVVNPGPLGLPHNLNHAARAVETPWIARMDADDLTLPGRFASQFAFLSARPDVDVLGGAIREVAPDGRITRRATPLDHAAIVRRALWRNPMNHMTVVMRREAFQAAGGYPDIPRKEDYALWLEMIGRGAVFANLPEDLVEVRLGDDFARRRAGLRNVMSEYRLHAIKRRLPGGGGPAGAAAFALRAAALSAAGPAGWLYRRVLR